MRQASDHCFWMQNAIPMPLTWKVHIQSTMLCWDSRSGKCRAELFSILVQFGADVMRRDADGDTAFSLAPIGRTLALCMDEGWESLTMLDIWRMSRFGHKNQVVVLLAGCKLLLPKSGGKDIQRADAERRPTCTKPNCKTGCAESAKMVWPQSAVAVPHGEAAELNHMSWYILAWSLISYQEGPWPSYTGPVKKVTKNCFFQAGRSIMAPKAKAAPKGKAVPKAKAPASCEIKKKCVFWSESQVFRQYVYHLCKTTNEHGKGVYRFT